MKVLSDITTTGKWFGLSERSRGELNISVRKFQCILGYVYFITFYTLLWNVVYSMDITGFDKD